MKWICLIILHVCALRSIWVKSIPIHSDSDSDFNTMNVKGSLIPSRLVTNHKVNLLSEPESAPGRAENIANIFSKAGYEWYKEFLSDEECRERILAYSERLARYFVNETVGMFKSDICRLVQLKDEGGLYVDTDLVLIADLRKIVPENVSFVSTISLTWRGPHDPNEMFQAILGAAPNHPIITRSLEKVLDFYDAKNATLRELLGGKMRGASLMRIIYEEFNGGRYMEPGRNTLADGTVTYFFEEHKLKDGGDPDYPSVPSQGGRGNNCDILVVDAEREMAIAYSHVLGKRSSCQPAVD